MLSFVSKLLFSMLFILCSFKSFACIPEELSDSQQGLINTFMQLKGIGAVSESNLSELEYAHYFKIKCDVSLDGAASEQFEGTVRFHFKSSRCAANLNAIEAAARFSDLRREMYLISSSNIVNADSFSIDLYRFLEDTKAHASCEKIEEIDTEDCSIFQNDRFFRGCGF